ncbi:MAG TPA: Calx-beta domain-containing protein [Gemmataceae bacterium]|nr:Calx-beta domain-containing protein [Gemmataceae bacterium]
MHHLLSRRPSRRASTRRSLRLETFEDRLTPAIATFQLSSDWGAGFVGTIRLANDQPAPIDGWRLEFDFPYQITQIWNGVIASHAGAHYVIDDAGYNRTINPGQAADFGFVGSPGNVTNFPANYLLNGVPLAGGTVPSVSVADFSVTEADTTPVVAGFAVNLSAASTAPVMVNYATSSGRAKSGIDFQAASGTLTFQPGETSKTIPVNVLGDLLNESNETFYLTIANPIGATLGTARATGTIVDNDPLPAFSVSDVSVVEPDGSAIAAGPLHTSGNQILDARNRPVRLSGVNWFGMEGTSYAPGGLWIRGYRDMMDQMRDLGFNVIRLPFSSQLFDAGSTPSGINFTLNPDLQGLNGLGIMDRIVSYAGQIGLRIILDHHRSEAGNGAEGNGLWYTGAYPEARWVADWQMLAQRYAGNPTVIAADLHNEPHDSANWGGGGATDWRLAAERAGNAILAVNTDWLIITEGVQQASSGWTWWGGNLSNAGMYPVRLDVPGRLVYSPHDYPASVYPQPWFSAPDYPHNLYAVWEANWGYLFRQGTAPILLGEFGSKLETTSDQLWADTIVNYLSGDLDGNGTNDLGPGQQGASWTWWSWNPNSGDTGGILQDDWIHVQQPKIDRLTPVQFGDAARPALATFTVTLSAPSGRTVCVNYATADGTATAGLDYLATSGTLKFLPGQTSKTVSVQVLADDITESPESFYLRLSNPRYATLADAEGLGTIRDVTDPPPPTIHAGDKQITEGNSGTATMVFKVCLSTLSTQPVTVHFTTADVTALAGSDYVSVSGTLTFAPGVMTQTITVPIVGDLIAENLETFQIVLSNPTNATLATDHATGTIVDNDSPLPAGIQVSFNARSDWGTGFVADMSITNNRPADVAGWTLEFDLNRTITNIWNAEIVSHVGTHYVLRAAPWNPRIAAHGGHVDFGFQGETGNIGAGPTNYVFNGLPLP